jgi:MraZ protein
MSGFIGSEIHSVDDKYRTSFPAKMMKHLPEKADKTFVITIGYDKCLAGYPQNIWDIMLEEDNSSLDLLEPKHRLYNRKKLKDAEYVKLDSQQRLALPKKLCDQIGIKGKVEIVGQGKYVEFWEPEYFDWLTNADPDDVVRILKDNKASLEALALEIKSKKTTNE